MAKKPLDLNTKILTEIRDEMRGMRAELVELRTEVTRTNARIDETNNRLTQVELHLATELVAVAYAVREVKELLGEQHSARLADHERRLAALEAKAS